MPSITTPSARQWGMLMLAAVALAGPVASRDLSEVGGTPSSVPGIVALPALQPDRAEDSSDPTRSSVNASGDVAEPAASNDDGDSTDGTPGSGDEGELAGNAAGADDEGEVVDDEADTEDESDVVDDDAGTED